MAEPVAPLVPDDLDLRDFAYMPLDVVRLRDSELATMASGDGFMAAVLLWCACWHQVPASSLPDDDRVLAKLAGYGRDVAGWQGVRDEALRGFVQCSDGRLYHPVIAGLALSSFRRRKRPRIFASDRREVFQRDAMACRYCSDRAGPFEIDHVYPHALGGESATGNYALACRLCNRSKGAKLLAEWLQ